jgi:hypothetical protein
MVQNGTEIRRQSHLWSKKLTWRPDLGHNAIATMAWLMHDISVSRGTLRALMIEDEL